MVMIHLLVHFEPLIIGIIILKPKQLTTYFRRNEFRARRQLGSTEQFHVLVWSIYGLYFNARISILSIYRIIIVSNNYKCCVTAVRSHSIYFSCADPEPKVQWVGSLFNGITTFETIVDLCSALYIYIYASYVSAANRITVYNFVIIFIVRQTAATGYWCYFHTMQQHHFA